MNINKYNVTVLNTATRKVMVIINFGAEQIRVSFSPVQAAKATSA
jgi:hypothetical protein